MTTVARRVAAIPVRSSVVTWHTICDLLASRNTAAHADLVGISSIAAVLIAEEYTSSAPIIITASGAPRVRVYTVHGDDAPDAEADESPLALLPCENDDWAVSLPCATVDISEITAALDGTSRFTVRDLDEGVRLVEKSKSAEPSASSAQPIINLAEMELP